MAPDATIWDAYGYIFTPNGWKYVTQFKFEAVPSADVKLFGIDSAADYVRLSGILYKDTDFDGTADDTAGIIRDGGMILSETDWLALATAIANSYNNGLTVHEDETFRGDGYAQLAYPAVFFGEGKRSDTVAFNKPFLSNLIGMPARAYVEYYDFDKSGTPYVHFCTDRFQDSDFDGNIDMVDAYPVLEHACGIMIPRDYAGSGGYVLAFATAISAYLASLNPT
jgi:hypothetical protein